VPLAVRSALALFGADYTGVAGAWNVAFALLHLIGVVVVLAAVLLAAWRLAVPGARLVPWQFRADAAATPRAGDLIADFLVIAMAANFAAFLFEVPMENIYSAHEIGPALSLGAALAGRVISGLVAARRGHDLQAPAGPAAYGAPRPGPRRFLLGALAAGLACYALMLGIAAAHKQLPPRNVGLTRWLAAHHLRNGLAPYWESSSVTVDSGGAITVLAVQPGPDGVRLEPQPWQSDVLLAGTLGRTADFVIISPAENVHRAYVIATFGKPARSYRYGPFTIMAWHKNLLPDLVTGDSLPSATAGPPRGDRGLQGR
jgi:hypothetical protein